MLKLSLNEKEQQISNIVKGCILLSAKALSYDTSDPNYAMQKIQLLLFNHFSVHIAPKHLLALEDVGAFYLKFTNYIAQKINNPNRKMIPLDYEVELLNYIFSNNILKEKSDFEAAIPKLDTDTIVHKI